MFCPNCAAQNDDAQHYCRMCGLRIDGIAANLSEQKPSAEMALFFKRKRQLRMLGLFSVSTAGVIGMLLLLSAVVYYKLSLLGPELLFGSALGAMILFAVASVFFFNYPRLFMKLERIDNRFTGQADLPTTTNKLLNDPPFEPASVAEHTTELLRPKSKTGR